MKVMKIARTIAVLSFSFLVPAAQNCIAAEIVSEGLQIGAQGALRVELPTAAKKYDLQFDIKTFNDSTAALLALNQGAVQVVNTTSQHFVRAISENIDAVWIMGWGGGNNLIVSLPSLNLANDDINGLKSLVAARKRDGKPVKIAVPTGSMQHLKLIFFLREIGIDADKDVQIVNIGFPTHPRALEAGEVDLAMTLVPFGCIAITKGFAKPFHHLFDKQYGKQEVGYIVMRKLIQEKPALVQAIVSAHADAMKVFIGNTPKHIELELKESRLPKAAVELQLTQYEKVDYRTNVADLKTMARQMMELGWVKEDYSSKVDSHVDLSFLAKATGRPVGELSKW